MSQEAPVFLGGKTLLVPSAYGLHTHYRLIFGQFKWPSEQRHALLIQIQDGDEPDLEKAQTANLLRQGPAHVLEEDLGEVLQAIQTLTD